jgi:hypothetical protein
MRKTLSAASLMWMMLFASVAFAQQCEVKLTSPNAEEWVVEQGDVIGTAKIPTGSFLWVLVRRDDQPKKFFWPQEGLAAKEVNGILQWRVSVHYGVAADRGHDFRAVTVVVDEATNARLENWREQAPSNDYKPLVGMPSSVAGCDPVEVIVKKSE